MVCLIIKAPRAVTKNLKNNGKENVDHFISCVLSSITEVKY